MNIPERYCVLDIETYTPTGEPDPTMDELRYVGMKSHTGRYRIFHYSQTKEIQDALRAFDYLVGHNIQNYDIPVLNRHGFYISAIPIDTYKIVEKRCKSMLYIDLNQGDRSLDRLLQIFKADIQKQDFDYSMLKKDKLEGDEYSKLESYLKSDLDGAEWLFKYFYDIFVGFKDLVKEYDRKRMNWLTCGAGATAYKCVCNMANLKEEYTETIEYDNDILYSGAFVSDPYNDYFE